MTTKVSFNLPDEVVEAAKMMAKRRKTTVTEVVRTAISNELYFGNAVKDGDEIVIRRKSGKEHLVIYPEVLEMFKGE